MAASYVDDAPVLNDSLDTIIIVDGLPKVPADKVDRLSSVVAGHLLNFNVKNIDMPLSAETNKTQGFAFIELATADDAKRAEREVTGQNFDDKRKYTVNRMADFAKIMATSETYTPPAPVDLESWLLEADCLDQYVVRSGDLTSIFWNKRKGREEVQRRDKWSDQQVCFSPRGAYLMTFHQQGLAVWGGPNWDRLARFAHRGVVQAEFSPCERFVMAWSKELSNNVNKPEAVALFDVATGAQLQTFVAQKDEAWPFFKWSADGQFFGRLENGAFVYYSSADGKKQAPLTAANGTIIEAAWSPSDNYVAICTAPLDDSGSQATRIVILNVLTVKSEGSAAVRYEVKELTAVNRIGVNECKLVWQDQGDFLAAKVKRVNVKKSKGKEDSVKLIGTNVELFSLRKKLVPCDTLELKDTIVDQVAWEPTGSKFSFLFTQTTTEKDVVKTTVGASFYSFDDGKIALLKKIDKLYNFMKWSPRGQYCVVAGLGTLGGSLEFWDTSDMLLMNTGEHFNCSGVSWDPTGRYVVSSISAWRQSMDVGYMVWSFQGKELQRHPMDKFYELTWRPRPKTLLKEADYARVRKNWKDYQGRFDSIDKLLNTQASDEHLKKRREQKDAFLAYLGRKNASGAARAAKLAALRPGWTETAVSERTETIEFVVNEDVEICERA